MTSPRIEITRRPSNLVAASRIRSQGTDELTSICFAARGVTSLKDVVGKYDDLLPGTSMKNLGAMAAYLADAAASQKRILIVSDYDCDGATACAVLVMGFGACGLNYEYLVPDRQIHGYGLTPAIVEEAAALPCKPDIIITVDNGISSIDGVARAKELGIEVLVTDHHLAPDVLPDATLIVNPNQPGCKFESKNIAGCGVAWYVIQALVNELALRGIESDFHPQDLLSYVAIGTVADVVLLDKNNRTLVSLGLELIREGACAPGVISLAMVSGKNYQRLTCSDIGFGLGPRINAAGRLSHMGMGIECLTTLEETDAHALAQVLNETNVERKDIQKDMVESSLLLALKLSKANLAKDDSDEFGLRSVTIFDESFHEGVVGIVAGRLKEILHRPTVVMTRDKSGNIKGSARSIPGYHLKHALDEINAKYPGILLKFGGHAMAAGMTIDGSRFEDFKLRLEEVCRQGLTPLMMTKTLLHDGALPARFLNKDSIFKLSQQVWGQGFEEPVFLNTFEVVETKVIGQDKSHLKVSAKFAGSPDDVLDVMMFGQADLAASLGESVVAAYKPGINEFRGESKIQMLVELLPEHLNPQIVPALARRAFLQDRLEIAGAGALPKRVKPSLVASSAAVVVEVKSANEPNATHGTRRSPSRRASA